MNAVEITYTEVHLEIHLQCRVCRTRYEPGDEQCTGCGVPLVRVCTECGDRIPMHRSARFLGEYWCMTHYEAQLF